MEIEIKAWLTDIQNALIEITQFIPEKKDF